MSFPIDKNFTVTRSGSSIIITYADTFDPVSFTGSSLQILSFDDSDYVNFTSDGRDTTSVDFNLCTNPVSANKDAFITNVQTLIDSAANPFNQDLNTTDSVIFEDVMVVDLLTTQDLVSATLDVNTIGERSTNNGVEIDGILIKDSEVNTDTIVERTSDTGVTIDGTLIKDNGATISGILTYTGKLRCEIRNIGTQSITSGVQTAIAFANTLSDADNMHSISTNNSRINIPRDGLYFVKGNVYINTGTSTSWQVALFVNGSAGNTSRWYGYEKRTTDGSVPDSIAVSSFIDLLDGDYVEIRVTQASGGAITLGHASERKKQCHFIVHEVTSS